MPAWSHYFGLTPADIDEMTLREVRSYADHMARVRAAAAEGNEVV